MSNNIGFKNPESITEFQAKVTLQDYINNNVDTTARIGGTFFNDTGNPNSGSQGDVYAQVYIRTGILGQAPYAAWVVLRFREPLSSGPYDVLGYGTFPLPINLNQAYTLYIKWSGKQFIFKCDEYAVSYTPPVPPESISLPNYPSRTLSTSIGTLTPYANFNGSIKAAFDDLIVSGVDQLTPVGGGVPTQPLDPTTGTTPVIITFDQVTQVGMTSLTTNTPDPPPVPEGFQMGYPPTYYDIATTATFTGPIDVAIHYAGVQYVDENALRLLHWENGEWVDCTTSVDTINKIIYGTVNSLSPFIIVEYSNRSPVLAPIGDQITNEGQLLQIVLSATDPDGNALSYSAENLPTGAAFDPETHTFSWIPSYDQAGSYPNIIFRVTDNGNPPLSAQEEITITVNNVNHSIADFLLSAGPNSWAVLGLGGTDPINNTKISMTGSSSVKGNLTDGVANVGVPEAGNFSMSGSSIIHGSLFLNTAGTLNLSGSSSIQGGLRQNGATDAVLNQAVVDALAASETVAGIPPTNHSITHINITKPSQSMTLIGSSGINVLNLTDLVITNGTLTLSAPIDGLFIINITGKFSLSGGSDILVGGGLSPLNVLYNIIGAGEKVSISGGTTNGVPNMTINGIILAPQREISVNAGLVIGEVIGGGKQITITSGGQVNNPTE